jgi:hypothetical protein
MGKQMLFLKGTLGAPRILTTDIITKAEVMICDMQVMIQTQPSSLTLVMDLKTNSVA